MEPGNIRRRPWIGTRAREQRRMDAEVDGAGPSAMVVESDSVRPSPMVTEVGCYAQT